VSAVRERTAGGLRLTPDVTQVSDNPLHFWALGPSTQTTRTGSAGFGCGSACEQQPPDSQSGGSSTTGADREQQQALRHCSAVSQPQARD
jgi:hypothetical protein